MDKTIRIIAAVLAVVVVASIGFLVYSNPSAQNTGGDSAGTIYFFYGEGCPACHYVMPFVINMTKKYPEADIQVLEVWYNQTNQQRYQEVTAAAGVTRLSVPQVVYGKTVLVGAVEIPEKMESLIWDHLKKKA
jgi:thiol-disulfide isomerase/thioredoxin